MLVHGSNINSLNDCPFCTTFSLFSKHAGCRNDLNNGRRLSHCKGILPGKIQLHVEYGIETVNLAKVTRDVPGLWSICNPLLTVLGNWIPGFCIVVRWEQLLAGLMIRVRRLEVLQRLSPTRLFIFSSCSCIVFPSFLTAVRGGDRIFMHEGALGILPCATIQQ